MRTAEEWGRVAVALPGWRWMRGSRALTGRGNPAGSGALSSDAWPDPDDPATAGCLLALLGPLVTMTFGRSGAYIVHVAGHKVPVFGEGASIGRACIAAAQALGRWPGGGK